MTIPSYEPPHPTSIVIIKEKGREKVKKREREKERKRESHEARLGLTGRDYLNSDSKRPSR